MQIAEKEKEKEREHQAQGAHLRCWSDARDCKKELSDTTYKISAYVCYNVRLAITNTISDPRERD